jgi:hypothetical protein
MIYLGDKENKIMQEFLNELSPKLKYIRKEMHDKTMWIYCESEYEGKRVHSRVERVIKDINFGNYQVELHILWKKYFDELSDKTTISEKFDFVPLRGRRTNRLDKLILSLQEEMSAVGCEKFIKENIAKVSDSTILRVVKKTEKAN